MITNPLEAAKESRETCQKIPLSVNHIFFFQKIVFEQSLFVKGWVGSDGSMLMLCRCFLGNGCNKG